MTMNAGLKAYLANKKKGKAPVSKLGLKNVANEMPAGGMTSPMVPNGVPAVAPKTKKRSTVKKSSNPFGFKAHGTMKKSK